ncbi:MAG: hypothetical protein P8J32_04675 [bacterium]|nr:hypothetical protein [bacterium]
MAANNYEVKTQGKTLKATACNLVTALQNLGIQHTRLNHTRRTPDGTYNGWAGMQYFEARWVEKAGGFPSQEEKVTH